MAIPTKTQILIIGGGPAGSYSAGLLAREGFNVVLLEADAHPRYHIGESLLPSMIPHLKFFGIENKIRTHGFIDKPGAACKFVKDQVEGYTDFISESKLNGAWNVERADFDNICFRHAGELGATLFENTKVTSIEFEESAERTPISATWKTKGGETGSIAFDYLVDASGRNGIMSNKYLKNRIMKDSLKNIAQWSYWTGAGRYMPSTDRENAPYFESLQDGSGWAWFIPLRERVSVGVVLHERVNTVRRKAASSLEDHYMKLLESAPNIMKLLGGAKRESEKVHQASDFSYSAADSAGPNFRIVGDASSFIDPLFSSGVHMAFVGGLSAAATIAASIRGDTDEYTAARYHDKKVATAYTRFLIVVLSVYRQIRRQDVHVLSDIDADNFQAAFDMIRPIIQGTSDSRGDVLSTTAQPVDDQEIQKTIEFCTEMLGGRGFKPDKESATAKYVKSAKYAQDSAKYPTSSTKYASSSEETDSMASVSSPASSVLEESAKYHDAETGYDASKSAKPTPYEAAGEETAATYLQEKSSSYPSERSTKYPTAHEPLKALAETSSKYPTGYEASKEDSAKYPTGYAASKEASTKYPTGYDAAKEASTKYPTGYVTSKEGSTKYPKEDSTKYPTGYEASKESSAKYPTGYEASKEGSTKYPTGYEASKEASAKYPTGYEASKETSMKYPKEDSTKYPTGYEASKEASAKYPTGYDASKEASTKYPKEGSTKYPTGYETSKEASAKYPTGYETSKEASAQYPTGHEASKEASAKYPTGYEASKETSTKYPKEDSTKYPTGYEASKEVSTKYPTGYDASKEASAKYPTGYEAAKEASTRYPKEDSTKYPTGYEASKEVSTKYPTGYEAAKEASTKYPTGYETSTKYPAGYDFQGSFHEVSDWLRSFEGGVSQIPDWL
jgi:flavin-dependent dehydrogenase